MKKVDVKFLFSKKGPVKVEVPVHTDPAILEPTKATTSLPQWVAGKVAHYTHEQPQWVPGVATAEQANLRVERSCATCNTAKDKCTCPECFICKCKLVMGMRHHCRKCWKAVCSSCRKRTRYVNAMAALSTLATVCDVCATYRGITLLTTSQDYIGVHLLREATDLPRLCVNNLCGAVSYQLMCPSCSMPTLTTRGTVERVVRITTNALQGKSNMEQRMAEMEEFFRAKRDKEFAALTPADVAKAFMVDGHGVSSVFEGVNEFQACNILLAAKCASLCYEYSFYPNTTLCASDLPYARLLHFKESRQLYSVLEGPNRTLFIAMPGTHDLRTMITDMQFQRVVEQQWSKSVEGTRADGRAVCGNVMKIWEYKLHSGFHGEEVKLRGALPTAVCRDYVTAGYTLVLCGHSLGGALAILVTLRLLTDDLAAFKNRIMCVTLGAPLVGNTALTRKVQRCGWTEYFHNLVYRSDIVPRLLCGRGLPGQVIGTVRNAVTTSVTTTVSAAISVVSGKIGNLLGKDHNDLLKEELDELTTGENDVERAIQATPDAADADPSDQGRVPFDCFGRYHFLFRGEPYSSTVQPKLAFRLLKNSCGLKTNVTDHFADNYIRAIGFVTRQNR